VLKIILVLLVPWSYANTENNSEVKQGRSSSSSSTLSSQSVFVPPAPTGPAPCRMDFNDSYVSQYVGSDSDSSLLNGAEISFGDTSRYVIKAGSQCGSKIGAGGVNCQICTAESNPQAIVITRPKVLAPFVPKDEHGKVGDMPANTLAYSLNETSGDTTHFHMMCSTGKSTGSKMFRNIAAGFKAAHIPVNVNCPQSAQRQVPASEKQMNRGGDVEM